MFLIKSDHPGVTIEAEPAMGLRAASLTRVVLEDVPAVQLGTLEDYAVCVRLSRLGWCALSLGAAKAVLDYVTPYVNERTAFGEPISHRCARRRGLGSEPSAGIAVVEIGDCMRLDGFESRL
ncbi:hypothetical protein EV644_12241 [Kribbella orskensis]|uniref:Uncharacterized protein n=1 Tax=Kribbella orskensis TaxID=2512216 RepID=A0ABY2BAN6_9ACTN|nr:hypothetical protein EV642_12441 [Kribbella sp. VKM Ac-2500]TCO13566.1 hypothetical protein EV644_12241 [Kribbella orskensis]